MRKEYQDYLFRKFPKIYVRVSDKNSTSLNCPFNSFGFECKDGWFRLLIWLSRYLQNYIDQQNQYADKFPDTHPKVNQVRAIQVKEKFGTLRFYTEGGNERTQSAISFTEYLSGFICETTGKTDDVGFNKKGWVKTHHKSIAKSEDFTYIDDSELRELINIGKQIEFNFDSAK